MHFYTVSAVFSQAVSANALYCAVPDNCYHVCIITECD
jgi:hypothetical protein